MLDVEASSFSFTVEHLGVAKVNGSFKARSGTLQVSATNPDSIGAVIVLDVASVHTNNSLRDRELRSEDFLDVRRYPDITIESDTSSRVDVAAFPFLVTGKMTVYGTTQLVDLPVRYEFVSGNDELIVHTSFTLQRSDFNLDFGFLMDSLVGDTIEVTVRAVARPIS